MTHVKTLYATIYNGIHMLCLIQTHIHIDTSSMKILTIQNISIIVNYAIHAFICYIQSFTLFLTYHSGNLFPTASRISLRIIYISS